MPLETSDLKQTAVLWAATGVDDYGEVELAAYVEIDVRWETGKRETIDAQGNTIAVDSTVVADREVAVGSIMFLGDYDDYTNGTDTVFRVVDYKEIPDVKNRQVRRVLSLMRQSNTLPALA